jgi:hypothetical protein
VCFRDTPLNSWSFFLGFNCLKAKEKNRVKRERRTFNNSSQVKFTQFTKRLIAYKSKKICYSSEAIKCLKRRREKTWKSSSD